MGPSTEPWGTPVARPSPHLTSPLHDKGPFWEVSLEPLECSSWDAIRLKDWQEDLVVNCARMMRTEDLEAALASPWASFSRKSDIFSWPSYCGREFMKETILGSYNSNSIFKLFECGEIVWERVCENAP